jgi:hypothetical protein
MAQLLLKIYLLLKLLAYFPLAAHFHRLPIHEKCQNVIAFASHSLHSALELTLIAIFLLKAIHQQCQRQHHCAD